MIRCGRIVVLAAAAALGGSACGSPSTGGALPAMPTVEQVRELLAAAGRAAAAGDDDALRRLFVDRRRVPDEEFQMFKASEFWTLTPARRVSRLRPDAFSVPLRAPAQKLGEAITVRKSLHLPLRWNAEGRLVILGAAEAERLARLPVPETLGGEPVVALVVPDDDSSLAGRNHFASEFWITASSETTRFHIRFDPPLVSPSLRADLPPVPAASSFGGEIWVEFLLDADGDPATGTRLDRVYEQAGGTWATGAAFYRGFGIDRVLKVHGKKNVMPGGEKAWALDAELMTHSAKPEKAGSDTVILTGGDSLVRKSVTLEGLDIAGDVLVLTVPAAAAGVAPGGWYRAVLASERGVLARERACMRGIPSTTRAKTPLMDLIVLHPAAGLPVAARGTGAAADQTTREGRGSRTAPARRARPRATRRAGGRNSRPRPEARPAR